MIVKIDGKWQYKLRVFGITLYQRSGTIKEKMTVKEEVSKKVGPVWIIAQKQLFGIQVTAGVGLLSLFNKHLNLNEAVPFSGSGRGYSITGTVVAQ
jgi:hypothetical protein